MNPDKLWEDIKDEYLCGVEAALRMTDKAARKNILNDVEEHLDRRYSELSSHQRNRQQYEAIIADMGPAQDYAELMTLKSGSGSSEYVPSEGLVFLNRLMTVVYLLALFCIVGWKISTGSVLDVRETPLTLFENDPQLVGQWVFVDLVQLPDAFVPGQKQCSKELDLKEMTFCNNGKTSGPWEWTKGEIYHPGDDSHAQYQVRQIDGQDYVFLEWISGDVSIRKEAPCYYVLKKEK